MITRSLATSAFLLSFTAACAQPAGGLGTSSGPSGGVVGAGGLNAPPPPGSGLITNPGATSQNGGTLRYGTGTSGNPPGATAPIGALPPGQLAAPGQSSTVSPPAASQP